MSFLAALGIGSALGSSLLSYFGQRQTNQENLGIARETNALTEREAERNRQFNAAEAEKNRLWQEEQTRQEREYNDPARQVERLQAAGLNPGLMLGALDAGNVTSGGSGATASGTPGSFVTGAPMQNPYASFDQLGVSIRDTARMVADIDRTKAEKRLIEQQGVSQEIANDYAHQEHIFGLRKAALDLREAGSRIQNNDALRDMYYAQSDEILARTQQLNDSYELRKKGLKLSNDVMESDVDLKQKQAALTATQEIVMKAQNEMNLRMTDAQIKSLYAGIQKISSEISLMAEQQKLTVEQKNTEIEKQANILANTIGVKKHNAWISKEISSKIKLLDAQYRQTLGSTTGYGLDVGPVKLGFHAPVSNFDVINSGN